jgi:hypothetical protein
MDYQLLAACACAHIQRADARQLRDTSPPGRTRADEWPPTTTRQPAAQPDAHQHQHGYPCPPPTPFPLLGAGTIVGVNWSMHSAIYTNLYGLSCMQKGPCRRPQHLGPFSHREWGLAQGIVGAWCAANQFVDVTLRGRVFRDRAQTQRVPPRRNRRNGSIQGSFVRNTTGVVECL